MIFQHITEPTHHRPNTNANVLDLVLTNEEAMINTIQYLPGIGSSDHICFSFIYIVILPVVKLVYLDTLLHQDDFDKLRELIQELYWDDILSPLNIHSAWKLFAKKFSGFIDECISQDIPGRKSTFMNHGALNLRNRKRKLWNKYIHSKSCDDHMSYCQVRNELCRLTRHLWTSYENRLISGAKENPRQLLKYFNINSQLKVRRSIDSLRGSDSAF